MGWLGRTEPRPSVRGPWLSSVSCKDCMDGHRNGTAGGRETDDDGHPSHDCTPADINIRLLVHLRCITQWASLSFTRNTVRVRPFLSRLGSVTGNYTLCTWYFGIWGGEGYTNSLKNFSPDLGHFKDRFLKTSGGRVPPSPPPWLRHCFSVHC